MNHLHILIVDDNEQERMESASLARNSTHVVEEATHGIEALTMAKNTLYDLILMDLDMPYLDGFLTTQAIRQLPEIRRHVPIMALTHTTNPEDVRKCFQVGMSNFILKPLTQDKLQAIFNVYVHTKTLLFPPVQIMSGR